MPDEVDPRDEHFDPRRGPIYVRAEGSEPKRKVLSWLPTRGMNRRLDYVTRVLKATGQLGRPARGAAWLLAVLGKPPGWLAGHDPRRAARRRPPDGPHLAAARSGRPGRRDVPLPAMPPPGLGVGPGCVHDHRLWRGAGEVLVPAAGEDDDHYRYLYRSLNPVPLSASEHTGQLASVEAADIQQRFIRGEVNALSCSTTFELGRGRGRAAVCGAAQHAADHSELRAAGRPGRTAHRLGCAHRHLRPAPVARPVAVSGPSHHGRRRGARTVCAAG